jgi:hypothetical protein
VDDHLHSHRKAMRAGTEAMGLWVLAGSWSGAEESDGWVPSYVLTRLAGPGAETLADRLVSAGLWHADTVESEDGYRFHEWETYQPTKARLEAKRADARERMARARAQGGDVRTNSAGTSRAVTPTPTRPDPTHNNTAADAAEFETWWEGYPRKIGKGAAAKAYTKARKSATADELMAGLTNACAVWQAARTEDRFIPHASTWLNRESWTDQQDALPAMPRTEPARASVTLRQCDGTSCPGTAHRWDDTRNHYHCQGA